MENKEIRRAKAIVDGITTRVTYYKDSRDFKFESNGESYTVKTEEIQMKNVPPHSDFSSTESASKRLTGDLQSKNSIRSLCYKEYYNNDDGFYWRKLYGPGFSATTPREKSYNKGKIDEFVKYVDKVEDLWVLTEGTLIVAGGGTVLAPILYFVLEPFLSKSYNVQRLL